MAEIVSDTDQGEGRIKVTDAASMISSLLDACRYVLEVQGEPRSCYWLASQIMEMKLWRATEAEVRDAVAGDIEKRGSASRFVQLDADEIALRCWGRR